MSHYFIAIPIQKELQEIFSSWQNKLRGELPYKQWPERADLHITLKFLGEVDDNKLKKLIQELRSVDSLLEFDLTVGRLGSFGKRVLWAGVEVTEALIDLQRKVELCCVNLGFEEETRQYRPHITLAKKWTGESERLDETILSRFTNQYKMHVQEIVLYCIHPFSSQKYEAVNRYLLN